VGSWDQYSMSTCAFTENRASLNGTTGTIGVTNLDSPIAIITVNGTAPSGPPACQPRP
jgi:hypothetical protein